MLGPGGLERWDHQTVVSGRPKVAGGGVGLSVANLAILSLDLATFQTPLATFFSKKRQATNLASFLELLVTF